MTTSHAARPPRSRFWLYLPFTLLAGLALAWCGVWYYAQGRVVAELDRIISREASLGRSWTCADRTVAGFPFRFEARCSSVKLTATRSNGDLIVTTGPLVVVAQIYNPQHVIVKAEAPALITEPGGSKTALRWSALDTSLIFAGRALDRLDTVIASPQFDAPDGAAQVPFKAASLEIHGRRSPARFASDGVVDLAMSAKAASLPLLDAVLGNATPADIALETSLTRATTFLTGFKPENIDLWRSGGGKLEVSRLAITKGSGRLETRGELALDDLRRLTGRLDSSAAGIERIAGIPVGGLGNLGGLLGGRTAGAVTADPALKPLPPVTFRDGRVQAGPLRIPNLQLPPMY